MELGLLSLNLLYSLSEFVDFLVELISPIFVAADKGILLEELIEEIGFVVLELGVGGLEVGLILLVIGQGGLELSDLVFLESEFVDFGLEVREGVLELDLVVGQFLSVLLQELNIVLLEFDLLGDIGA